MITDVQKLESLRPAPLSSLVPGRFEHVLAFPARAAIVKTVIDVSAYSLHMLCLVAKAFFGDHPASLSI